MHLYHYFRFFKIRVCFSAYAFLYMHVLPMCRWIDWYIKRKTCMYRTVQVSRTSQQCVTIVSFCSLDILVCSLGSCIILRWTTDFCEFFNLRRGASFFRVRHDLKVLNPAHAYRWSWESSCLLKVTPASISSLRDDMNGAALLMTGQFDNYHRCKKTLFTFFLVLSRF